ncbi:fasciclin domain-containing protein [Devosia sp.]|uniref:fasciclin domain-containing protein n=1 Tax=Devosia sp. TaxID=1871048 RepID=UPI003BA8B1C0
MKFLKALTVASMLVLAPVAAAPVLAANVVETAQSAGTFNTLIAAATAAGLAETLATTADITVFAPTDAAFAALPAGTVDDLLKPENKDKLIAILTAHVVGSKIAAADIAEGTTEVQTLNPAVKLKVTKDAMGVTVALSNSAKVTAADVAADNGVIHVIDAVLLP